jgi:hypothetical protein
MIVNPGPEVNRCLRLTRPPLTRVHFTVACDSVGLLQGPHYGVGGSSRDAVALALNPIGTMSPRMALMLDIRT